MPVQVDDVTPRQNLMDFPNAITQVMAGRRIGKQEWEDRPDGKGSYGYIADGRLCLHKTGEDGKQHHPWLLSEADMMGLDWFVLETPSEV